MRDFRPIRSLLAIVVVAAVAATGTALADTVTITPDRDNTLYESAGGLLSNGAGQYVFTGRTAIGSVRRALLHFDVAGSVPAGATIQSATLTLNMSKTIVGAQNNSLHVALADWGEGTSDAPSQEGTGTAAAPGDATWIHTFFDTQFWAAAGGDFAPTASATTPVAFDGPYTWGSTPQMVADVQSWLDDPAGNRGWVLVGEEGASPTAKRFDSRESSNPPALTVTYTTGGGGPSDVPTVSEWGLILMTLLLLTAGTMVFGRRAAVGGPGRPTLALAGAAPWLNPRLLAKTSLVTAALLALGLVGSALLLGELSAVDVVGSLLCAPVVAYLAHLWMQPRR